MDPGRQERTLSARGRQRFAGMAAGIAEDQERRRRDSRPDARTTGGKTDAAAAGRDAGSCYGAHLSGAGAAPARPNLHAHAAPAIKTRLIGAPALAGREPGIRKAGRAPAFLADR